MDRHIKIAFFSLLVFGVVSIGLVYLYSDGISVLSPKGWVARRECSLLWISTIVMLFVVVPVFILTFFIPWKYRANRPQVKYDSGGDSHLIAEAIWWGFPLLIILVLGVLTWRSCHELDPFKPLSSSEKPLKIQAVALQWKWLFIYPEEGVATINFLPFPEKTPLNFEITADAPMNSFWIPDLGGQIYAMAGMRSKLHLIADGIGTYRGCSSNISGSGFSGMTFLAKSTSRREFDEWVASAREAAPLTLEEYNRRVDPSEYDPPATYALSEAGLFDGIVMKYMMPMEGHASSH